MELHLRQYYSAYPCTGLTNVHGAFYISAQQARYIIITIFMSGSQVVVPCQHKLEHCVCNCQMTCMGEVKGYLTLSQCAKGPLVHGGVVRKGDSPLAQ